MPMTVRIAALICIAMCSASAADDARWFPVQATPKRVVRTVDAEFPEPRLAYQMLVQSVAGLAAKSVNEGNGDELVWITTGNADIERWGEALRNRQNAAPTSGPFTPWELVNRFQANGIIKGYILCKLDASKGALNEHRSGMDVSVNVATSLAGLLDGVIIDEQLETEAKAHGLKLLIDVRDKTQDWCFETYRDQFNRRLLCAQDPKKPHVRDMAIAQKALTIYGDGETTQAVLKWLEPVSPIIGWNGGDEFETTRASTVQGHFQTATDWCMNLPVLMAGSERTEPAKVKAFDPHGIDWSDRRSAVSFVSSDGDNVQWLEGSFFGNPNYWGSPERGKSPYGWSCCFTHLQQLCPPAIDFAVETQRPNDRWIEWGGGYYYPDLFASERTDRWELLAKHAQRTWELMVRNNTRVIGFNVANPQSPDALRAYETFAAQTDGLLGILVFQYAPYEGGAGTRWWVKDKRGVEIPVITARYSVWEHANDRPRAGTPAKVAREILEDASSARQEGTPRYDWAIAHAWSYFQRAPGNDEDAETIDQRSAARHGGERGYVPMLWCAERLHTETRAIDPEELLWRVRMERDPKSTKEAIDRMHP
jgi:hypothetical protein